MLSLVTAIIRPHMLEGVKDALKIMGVSGMTVTEVQGFGRQGGHTETYRGAEYSIDFLPKIRVEVLADDDASAEEIVKVICSAAQSGKIGDGKVWVTPVSHVVRIRTGEMGAEAL